MSISRGINENIEANAAAEAPLTQYFLDRAMGKVPRFGRSGPIVLSPKKYRARLEGNHPLYPPDDPALMDHWRAVAERFWDAASCPRPARQSPP